MSTAAVAAIAIFIIVFAVATLRGVHLGILMFVAACLVGPALAGMALRDVITGFPLSLLLLVAGVTYFFGIARNNGTTERVMASMLDRTGGRPAVVPLIFFTLAAVASAMGSPQAGLVTAPVGMPTARQARVDPVLMAVAINCGISAGAFAPTSLFGVITHRIARQAGIDIGAFTLLGAALMANLVLLVVGLILFSASRDGDRTAVAERHGAPHVDARPPLTGIQWLTLACMLALVAAIVGCAWSGVEPDIAVITLGLGALLTLADPSLGSTAFARIDWSTAFVVGGIVTYVGVLQKLDAVNLLGHAAMAIGTPMLAAFVVCLIAALVSAFASTTAVLAALVPLAVPLATSGAVSGWALITALGICATIVDASPFSNTGATLIASAPDEDRPRLRLMLLRWGMAMVVVGPLVLVPWLVLVGRLG